MLKIFSYSLEKGGKIEDDDVAAPNLGRSASMISPQNDSNNNGSLIGFYNPLQVYEGLK